MFKSVTIGDKGLRQQISVSVLVEALDDLAEKEGDQSIQNFEGMVLVYNESDKEVLVMSLPSNGKSDQTPQYLAPKKHLFLKDVQEVNISFEEKEHLFWVTPNGTVKFEKPVFEFSLEDKTGAYEAECWFYEGEVGNSSKAMCFAMYGIGNKIESHPFDPDDFRRCIKFLEAVPNSRERLEKVKSISPEWESLFNHWSEIETLFIKESHQKSAPETYIKIKDVLAAARPSKGPKM